MSRSERPNFLLFQRKILAPEQIHKPWLARLVDLFSTHYLSANNLYTTIMRYGNKLAEFTGATWGEISVMTDEATERILELAVPAGATQAQMEQINQAFSDLASIGVQLTVRTLAG